MKRPKWGRRRVPLAFDERGGRPDGGLAILDADDNLVHMTTPPVATALRYFLAHVHLHDTGGLPAKLAVTSALRGEGVTYITRSVASVLAYDTERSVVIVDTNWLAPHDDAALDPGLADVVERDAELDSVLIPTSNPRLFTVAAGSVAVARRPAVARSDRLDDAIQELSKRFDHVLIDLPPVLASSDAMSLSQAGDSFVFVIRQGATASAQVEAALEEMRGADPLGVVLNRFSSRIPRRLRQLVGT